MTMSINLKPAMTRYLVDAGVFRSDPITIIDVGARWGFRSEWQVFGKSLKVYCLEPDEAECRRLNASAAPNVTYIPAALGRESSEATLYEAKLSASTGLYKTNMDYFSRLLNRDNGEVVNEHRIQVATLDDTFRRFAVPKIDFIKLDVEGAELDVLKGGEHYVLNGELIGILAEIRFQEEINGSPVFSEFDSYVRKYGFRLFGLDYSHQSRRALPYPGLGDYRLPSGEKFYAYTAHGQVMDGDALYFRDLLISANSNIRAQATPTQILKAAAFFEIYCLNDCAAEILLAHRDKLRDLVNCDVLLDLLTPTLDGQTVGYKNYMDAYFEPNSAVVKDSLTAMAIKVRTSKLKNFLRRRLPPSVKKILRQFLSQ